VHRAAELLKAAEKHLREAQPDIIRVTPAGDFRRGCELAGDLSLAADVRKLPNGPRTITAGGQLTVHLTVPRITASRFCWLQARIRISRPYARLRRSGK
jgi:hypothetical protein